MSRKNSQKVHNLQMADMANQRFFALFSIESC